MKKVMLLVALVAVLVPLFAVSAGAQTPKKSLGEYVLVPATPPVMSIPFKPGPATTPKYCKPCLFYSGDMDPNSSDNNGLFNADDSPLGITAYVYAAFTATAAWKIEGLFINTLSNATAVDPTVTWDIRTGVTSGSGGTDVATGTGTQTWNATGRSAFGYSEYTDFCKLKKAQSLKKSKSAYFENVWTSCTTSSCNGDLFYESDNEHQPGLNQYPPGKKGEQPWDDSYFNSSSFGYSWYPTWGSSGACGDIGCDQFSDGATGK